METHQKNNVSVLMTFAVSFTNNMAAEIKKNWLRSTL